jgi:hypothetical protein
MLRFGKVLSCDFFYLLKQYLLMKNLFVSISLQRVFSGPGYNPNPAGFIRAGLGLVSLCFIRTDIVITVEKHARNCLTDTEVPDVPAIRTGQDRKRCSACPDPDGWTYTKAMQNLIHTSNLFVACLKESPWGASHCNS